MRAVNFARRRNGAFKTGGRLLRRARLRKKRAIALDLELRWLMVRSERVLTGRIYATWIDEDCAWDYDEVIADCRKTIQRAFALPEQVRGK